MASADYAGVNTGIRTSARFFWTQGALFVAFELSGAGLDVNASFPVTKERPKLYEEDCVELFLVPDAARREHYYEMELGPPGHFFDLEIDRAAKTSRAEWSSQLQIETTTDAAAHTALIEARLIGSRADRGIGSRRALAARALAHRGQVPAAVPRVAAAAHT